MAETLIQDATKAAEDARFAVSKLAAHIVSLGRELEDCEKSWRLLLQEDEIRHKNEIKKLHEVIHKFLDTVQRPVGTGKYEVLDWGEANRAIVALFDTVGRTL